MFTDEGDHSFFESVLKKKSTFFISHKAQNLILNEDMIIAFASFTKKKNNEFGLIIIDCFAALRLQPKKIFHHSSMNVFKERVLVNYSSI